MSENSDLNDVITYVELLVSLYVKIAERQLDSPETEEIRKGISALRGKFSDDEMLRLNYIALDLKKIHNTYLLRS